MGGGRQLLKTNASDYPWDPVIHNLKKTCLRTDGRDLIKEWAQGKSSEGVSYAVVHNTKTLRDVDTENTDYLLGNLKFFLWNFHL